MSADKISDKTNEIPKTPEQIELEWYQNVYQGDKMKQLTLRAVLMGSVLGALMSLSNLYIGLKTGWAFGVSITACILSFSIWSAFHRLFPKLTKSHMSILENNCMQSTASSAGYSTGGTMVSAIAAYIIITGTRIDNVTLYLWTFFLAVLGVFLAVPMKRQMINIEQLKFPTGTAAAETLRGLHAEGALAKVKSKLLGYGGLFGGLVAWFRDATASWMPFNIPGQFHFPQFLTITDQPIIKYTFSLDASVMMIAAGAIIGIKTAWSLLIGAIINWGILAPQMYKMGVIKELGFRGVVSWSLWGGVAIMLSSGLLSFAFNWRVIVRAFSGITAVFFPKTGGSSKKDPIAHIEVPGSWFIIGTGLSGLGTIILLHYSFNTTYWMGLVAILLSFVLAIVACRATGETDITPVGALGKITQLTYGVLAPTNMVTNLMTASVTANVAGSTADLLTELKSGYLLGANARKQFLAQFLGIFGGTLVIVPVFNLLVPKIGTDAFPAPAAQVWAGVAKLLSAGFESLHPTARWAFVIGTTIGILITLIDRWFPKCRKYSPSAMGLGLAAVIPAWNSISMFIGAVIAYYFEKRHNALHEKYTVTVASGIIAGESLIGILIALLSMTGILG